MRRLARVPDWYRQAQATAGLPGLKRLRQIVQQGTRYSLTDGETQPITLQQAREVLALVLAARRRQVGSRFEIQVYRPRSGWVPAGFPVPLTLTDGWRQLARCPDSETYRLVRLTARVIERGMRWKRGR